MVVVSDYQLDQKQNSFSWNIINYRGKNLFIYMKYNKLQMCINIFWKQRHSTKFIIFIVQNATMKELI